MEPWPQPGSELLIDLGLAERLCSLHSKTLLGTVSYIWGLLMCWLDFWGGSKEFKGNLCLRKWDFVNVVLMVFSPTLCSEQSIFETYL